MHLLKASSKPIPSARKRRKIEVKGTLSQYKDAVGASQQQQADPQMQQQFDFNQPSPLFQQSKRKKP